MDNGDEKFFETLSGARPGADEGYEVELARANSGALASRTRIPRPKAESWHEKEPEGQLTVDVYQTPMEIVVESAIAGVKPDDIDINVTPDSISIRGSRQREKGAGDEDYL